MKRMVFMGMFLIIGVMLFAGVPAVVKEVHGKVAIKAPGGRWIAAKPGMKLAKSYKVSTGFNSRAVLQLGESLLVVKQLTRMELSELIKRNGVIHTSLYLRVGKIKATVKSAKGLRQDFRVRSPISTAAVRGTSFEFDGVHLKVLHGTVSFLNNLGQRRFVGAGEMSMLTGIGLPKSGQEVKQLISSFISSGANAAAIGSMLQNINLSNLQSTMQNLMEQYSNIEVGSIDVTVNIHWE